MWIFFCIIGISKILESVESIRNSSPSSRIPNIKTINNYISMVRLKAKFPAPRNLTVIFSQPPGIHQKMFPSPSTFVDKNFVGPQDALGDGQGKNCTRHYSIVVSVFAEGFMLNFEVQCICMIHTARIRPVEFEILVTY